MHKSKRARRKFRTRQKKPKTGWARYLLLPVAALALASWLHFRKPDTVSRELAKSEISAAAKKDDIRFSKEGYIDLRNTAGRDFTLDLTKGRSFIIPAEEIHGIVVTPCCKMIFLTDDSKAVKRMLLFIGRNPMTGGAIMIGSMPGHDGKIRGCVLMPIGPGGFTHTLDVILGSFNPSTRKEIEKMTKSSNFEERKQLLDTIMANRPFSPKGKEREMYQLLLENSKKAEADRFLSGIAVNCILRKAISGKLGDKETHGKEGFRNIMFHESTHAAMAKYAKDHDMTSRIHNDNPDTETFGYLSEIAYGTNPWQGLENLLHVSSIYIPYKAAEVLTVLSKGERRMIGSEYFEITSIALARLMKALKVDHPLEIPDKNEKELRAAARVVLDNVSMRIFKKRFEEIIPIKEVRWIQKKGMEYFERSSK